ncbi:TKL protein kinase [Apostichopus japonicus]|uniref:TKL protein kinase n=1 Tax=Stichopus japonicus TaxID=307972 RepID=A0A2G8JXW5_STIJA|nr:TKL protein kinase [Apostichopus japonicus]
MKDGYNFVTMAKCIRRLEKHPNIVEFLGCSIDEVPYFVYQENMDNGTLRDFLLKKYQQQRHSMLEYPSGTAFPRELQQPTVFGNDVDKAMHFLHKNERDPPLAWLPPETIFLGQYNLSADIWSYGVFLWELFSFGEVPYHSRDKREIEDAVRNMECLSRPPFCPGAIFGIMLTTWKRDREDRPQMSEITQHLEKTCMTFQKLSVGVGEIDKTESGIQKQAVTRPGSKTYIYPLQTRTLTYFEGMDILCDKCISINHNGTTNNAFKIRFK